jgi:two-component system, cell cycle sensor histidine kinase and response regulator CckA
LGLFVSDKGYYRAMKKAVYRLRFLIPMLLLTLAPALPSPAAPTAPLEKVTLQLKWKHQFQFAGYYAAQAKGFYRDEGLEVTVKELRKPQSIVDELTSGRADFAVMDAFALLSRMQGQPIVALAVIFQHSPFVVLTRNPNLNKLDGLIGQRILGGNSQGVIELQAMLLREGIPLTGVRILHEGASLDNFLKGEIEATVAYSIDEYPQFKKAGLVPGVIKPLNYGIDFYGDTLVTTQKEFAGGSDKVERFRRASVKGWEYAFAHPDEIISHILELPGVRERGVTESSLGYEMRQMRDLCLPDLVEIGHMNPGRWEQMARILVDVGMFKGSYSLEGFLFTEDKEPVWLKRIGLIAGAAAFVVALSLIWIVQLNLRVKRRTAELSAEVELRRAREEELRASNESMAQLQTELKRQIEEKNLREIALSRSLDQIRDAQQRLTFHINNMPLGYIGLDRDLHVTEWNRAAEMIFGRESGEVLGRSALNVIVDGEAGSAFSGHWQSLLRGEAGGRFVNRNVRKSGERFTCEWFDTPLRDGSGRVVGILSMVHDISAHEKAEKEKAELEEQLRQSQKMEAIGTLAGGVAHDFNNILSAILGYSELTLEQLPEGGEASANIRRILQSAIRARDVVQQILAFSQRRRYEARDVEFAGVARAAIRLVRAATPSTIEIKDRISQNCGYVHADPTQLNQVLMNLCSNASHAMREKGGVMEICAEAVRLNPAAPGMPVGPGAGAYVLLTVKDTGHGMDAETRQRIFEPYFTTKGVGEGSGLGLSVVHGIIAAWGGGVAVESEPGAGSTFKVYLPQVESPARLKDAGAVAAVPRGKERILFVDDEETLVDVTNRILSSLGYRVTATTSSTDALEKFAADPSAFDLVITDQTLPQLTGAALTCEMIKIRPDIPVIITTGFSETVDEVKAREIGARDFLMKPLDRQMLIRAISRIFVKEKST